MNNININDINDKDFEIYKDKGLTGLANLGNSCYINSCMQVVSHTYELNKLLKDDKFVEKLNECPDSIILVEWNKLKNLMWSENCTVAPYGFFRSIQEISVKKNMNVFGGFSQNDMPEFLGFIIDCFHTAINREVDMSINGSVINDTDKLAKACFEMIKNMHSKSYSEILELFYGVHVSLLTSIEKNEILALTPEPFSILSLPIPNKANITLFDCLDFYCLFEKLEGDNAWYNEKTKEKQDVNKGIVFWSLPNILIIDLKRFTNFNKKISNNIDIPINDVDFSKYVKGYNKETYIYDLYGVCNHIGNCFGGHYTSYVKNANNKWYEFNDTSVNEISESNIISEKSYCLFYRKKK